MCIKPMNDPRFLGRHSLLRTRRPHDAHPPWNPPFAHSHVGQGQALGRKTQSVEMAVWLLRPLRERKSFKRATTTSPRSLAVCRNDAVANFPSTTTYRA